ncbi:FAD-binding oxidoreductase [Nitratireductor mangrovi]|uniref:FAD-binding oxidoreductase n=1 Tax=Nitratireductor mangrovi TaxID=2599600 RepID=A0A5B8KXF7_9HYPH|nr:FAD-binding oxidoreductase [Nitratireductor mangrovi]QDZ00384.1 FAD-binding oxidoreductase [Nitratireductor mangrovi]
MSRKVDVAIIGGGIAGVSLAYFLAPHRSVAVLEREEALGYHSTGRSAAEFSRRFHTPTVGKLAEISYRFLTEPPAGFAEIGLLKPRGNLVIADAENRTRLQEIFAGESATSPDLEMLSVEEALTRAPILNPGYVAAAFFDPECWDMEADSLLQGFAKGARVAGAEILNRAELLSVARQGKQWVLDTGAGEVRADIIVNAAGGWADTVAQVCGVGALGIQPLRRTAITVDAPDGVDVGSLPEISEVRDKFYIKPEAGRLLVSPSDETPVDPYDAQAEEIDVAYAAWYLEQATTVQVRRVAHSWAGLRSFAPDRAPVVGYSGKAESFFWLAGQGGFGIMTSPALGRLAAELMVDGTPSDIFAEHCLESAALSPKRLEGDP